MRALQLRAWEYPETCKLCPLEYTDIGQNFSFNGLWKSDHKLTRFGLCTEVAGDVLQWPLGMLDYTLLHNLYTYGRSPEPTMICQTIFDTFSSRIRRPPRRDIRRGSQDFLRLKIVGTRFLRALPSPLSRSRHSSVSDLSHSGW